MNDRPPVDIAQLSATLAADNARIGNFVEGLTRRIDDLVDAAADNDWNEVGRLCDFIARSSAAYGYPQISQSAESVCQAASENENSLELRRRLLKLIGACGQVRMPMAEERKPEAAD